MNWLGLDIGGANIKIADGRGYGRSIPFRLWQQPEELAAVLGKLIAFAPSCEGIAVTMTGELADCFETKRQGVLHILDAVAQACDSRTVAVYLVDGRFVSLTIARAQPLLAAASNWHALARYVSRLVSEFPALLIDIGSTTTDVIPLVGDGPLTPAQTDTERLLRGELIYLGMSRTPVAAIARQLPYRGHECPIATELFATTADVSLLMKVLPEQPRNGGTADGRPLTWANSRDRMARMLCADREIFSEADAHLAAQFVWQEMIDRVRKSIERVIEEMAAMPKTIVLSGIGEVLGQSAIATLPGEFQVELLSERLESPISSVAPAHAVAVLGAEAQIEL